MKQLGGEYMNVSEILDPKLLEQYVEDGWVSKRKHPDYDLYIYNYTPQCAFARKWDDITINCRGLILDDDLDIVARPYRKFFNWDDPAGIQLDLDAEVTVVDKLDGSLGILYSWYDENKDCVIDSIATRGSFESEQAKLATKIWNDKYCQITPPAQFTFLYEICGPSNRIVLFYPENDLVLLGAVHTQLGYYISPNDAAGYLEWPGEVAETFEYKTLKEALLADPRPNAEGYVIRINNDMAKVKQEDYLALHKIVTNLNERTVWQALKDGQKVDDFVTPLPDEFQKWALGIIKDLDIKFEKRYSELVQDYKHVMNFLELDGRDSRKDFAMYVKDKPHKAFLFALLDKKPISNMIWDEIRPVGDKIE